MSKTIKTRIRLKYDTLANWNNVKDTFIPLKGEMCVVEVPSNDTSGTATNPPTIVFKVGDGTTKFVNLPWCSGYSADVYSWAKKTESEFIAWAKTQIVPDEAITEASLGGSGSDTVVLSIKKGETISTYSVKVNNVESAERAEYDSSGNEIIGYYLPKQNVLNKGSATNPVYFDSNGTAKPTTYQLNASVPSGAVFTDTKNTAGATNSTSKLYLIGATSQDANPQTYSNSNVYATNGTIFAKSFSGTDITLSSQMGSDTITLNLNPIADITYVVNSNTYSLRFPAKSGFFAMTSDITKSAVGLGDVVNAGRDNTPTSNSTNYVTSGGVKTYVDNAVATMSKFQYQVVDALPTASASTVGIIYLVADAHSTGDAYDEYITILSGTNYIWEKIGNTDIDLSNYARTDKANEFVTGQKFGVINVFSVIPTDTLSDLGGILSYWNNLYLKGNLTDGANSTTIANIAKKTDLASKGSATQPVYFDANGAAQPITYTINKSVPSDAVFTDTKNTAGATNTTTDGGFYIIGASSQGANPQTYSNSNIYFNPSDGRIVAKAFSANDTINGTYYTTSIAPSGSIDFTIGSTRFTSQLPAESGTLALTSDIPTEANIKSIIETYPGVNKTGTVTSVAADSTYLTGGTITTSGTIGVNTSKFILNDDSEIVILNGGSSTEVI